MTINNNDLEGIERSLSKTRKKMFRDFRLFRHYYFRDFNFTEDAAFHGIIVDLLCRISTKRNAKMAIAAPRGSAKSTIVATQYIIYSICYHIDDFIILISSAAENAAESLTNIKNQLESNDRLRKDFPEVCELDKKPEPKRWARNEIITKNNIKVTALGVGQRIRGKRHNEHRPSLIILDDIEGNEAVQQEDSRYKLQDWFEKSVLKAGDSGTNFIFTGTIHHYGSLLAKYTDPKQAPGWEKRIFRSIIKWSEAIKEWGEWKSIFFGDTEYNGRSGMEAAEEYFKANQEKMLADTEVLWPQSKSYYDLMVKREQEGDISFDSEFQNEPVNPRDCSFNINELRFWDDTFSDEIALMKSIPYPVFYAACDPSMGKQKGHGDFSALIIGIKDPAKNILFVIDVDMERRQPEDLLTTILGYAKSRNIQTLGIESNNFQQVLVDELKKRASESGISLNVVSVEHNTNKIARIQALQPFLKTGKIQLSRKHRALIDQLKYFPKGQHDDGPDALEMLFHVTSKHSLWDFVS